MRISRAGALAGTLFLALPAAAQTAAGPVSEPPASAATDGDPQSTYAVAVAAGTLGIGPKSAGAFRTMSASAAGRAS